MQTSMKFQNPRNKEKLQKIKKIITSKGLKIKVTSDFS